MAPMASNIPTIATSLDFISYHFSLSGIFFSGLFNFGDGTHQ